MSLWVTPGDTVITLTAPRESRSSWVVAFGKLPWIRPSWLPNTVYQGMSRPSAVNGCRQVFSRPGTVGNPWSLRSLSGCLPPGVPSGCQ